MRRLKILQFVLPLLLLLFVAWLVLEFRTQDGATKPVSERDGSSSRRLTGVEYVDTVDGRPTISAIVGELVEEDDQIEFIDVQQFILYRRDGEQPVEIEADHGVMLGPAGRRRIEFDGNVVLRDLRDDITLYVPDLRVNESTGEALADREIRIESGHLGGHAGSLVYGLEGQPTRFLNLDLVGDDGTRLQARQALLFDGLDDMELVGDVRVERPTGDRFVAGRARVLRTDGRLRWLRAEEQVVAELGLGDGATLRVSCEELEGDWDENGLPRRFLFRESAEVVLDAYSIRGDEIEVIRHDTETAFRWGLGATGTVVVQGLMDGGRGWLRCDRFQAETDGRGGLIGAEATGEVRFDAGGATAEAARATLRDFAGDLKVVLWGTPRRKARLTRERLEIAAVQIRTDSRGSFLEAEEKVEATMLPAGPEDGAGPLQGMFRTDEPIHFVARSLEGRNRGALTVFRGRVRAWQGERNLSAEIVELDRDQRTLQARDRVSSRFPRRDDLSGTATEDFIQIVADMLEFDDLKRQAVYEGKVRVRLTEGWVETARLEVDLLEAGGIAEIRGVGQIRLEFRQPKDDDSAGDLLQGTADRLVYIPAEEQIILYGDTTPATVTQVGSGVSRARVLRYRLDTGNLEVDAGEQDLGTIKTKDPR